MHVLNDNENFSLKNINDNVNERPFVVGSKPREVQAYRTARKLVEAFKNPGGLRYYYGIALKLSESEIWQNHETAMSKKGVNHRGKYFTTLCNNAISRLV